MKKLILILLIFASCDTTTTLDIKDAAKLTTLKNVAIIDIDNYGIPGREWSVIVYIKNDTSQIRLSSKNKSLYLAINDVIHKYKSLSGARE